MVVVGVVTGKSQFGRSHCDWSQPRAGARVERLSGLAKWPTSRVLVTLSQAKWTDGTLVSPEPSHR